MKKLLFMTVISLLSGQLVFAQGGIPDSQTTMDPAANPSSTDIMGGSTPGGAQRRNNSPGTNTNDHLNAPEKMEERNNNSSIRTEAEEQTDSDGENYDRFRTEEEKRVLEKDSSRELDGQVD